MARKRIKALNDRFGSQDDTDRSPSRGKDSSRSRRRKARRKLRAKRQGEQRGGFKLSDAAAQTIGKRGGGNIPEGVQARLDAMNAKRGQIGNRGDGSPGSAPPPSTDGPGPRPIGPPAPPETNGRPGIGPPAPPEQSGPPMFGPPDTYNGPPMVGPPAVMPPQQVGPPLVGPPQQVGPPMVGPPQIMPPQPAGPPMVGPPQVGGFTEPAGIQIDPMTGQIMPQPGGMPQPTIDPATGGQVVSQPPMPWQLQGDRQAMPWQGGGQAMPQQITMPGGQAQPAPGLYQGRLPQPTTQRPTVMPDGSLGYR